MIVAVVILSVALVCAIIIFCFAYFPCRKKRNLAEAKYRFLSDLADNVFVPWQIAEKADALPNEILMAEFRNKIIEKFKSMINLSLKGLKAETLGAVYLELKQSMTRSITKDFLIKSLTSAIEAIAPDGLSHLLSLTIYDEIINEVPADLNALQVTRKLIMDVLNHSTRENKMDAFVHFETALSDLINKTPNLKPDERTLIAGERIKIRRALMDSY